MAEPDSHAVLELERFLPYRLSVLSNTVSQAIADSYERRFELSITEWRVMAVLGRYGVRLNLDQRTGELAPVDQARLAIVRAAEDLRRYRTQSGYKHSVLVLDEPTVFLPEEEVEHLFDLIRTVVAEGAAVLFISHDLVAVRSITERVPGFRRCRLCRPETADHLHR